MQITKTNIQQAGRKLTPLGLLFLLHLLFFVYQLFSGQWYLKDSHEYVAATQNLWELGLPYAGDWSEVLRMDLFSKRPLIYPLLLLPGWLIGQVEVWGALVQMGLSLFSMHLALKLFAYFFPDKNPRRLWMLLLLTYPAQLIFANLLMSELLLQALLMGMLYTALMGWEGKLGGYWVWLYHLLLGLAIWTKPLMYLFVLPNLILGGYWAWKKVSYLAPVLALSLILGVGGFMGKNAQFTTHVHFSSIQNLSLHQYSTTAVLKATYGTERGYDLADSLLLEALSQADYGSEQRLLQQGSVNTILDHPGTYVVQHLKGMLSFYLDPGRFEWAHMIGFEATGEGLQSQAATGGVGGMLDYVLGQPLYLWLPLLLVFLANLLKFALMGVALLTKSEVPRLKWALILSLLYVSGLTGISGASRFAVPVFPMIFLLATLGWLAWQKRLAARK